jgi:hypothetical protein
LRIWRSDALLRNKDGAIGIGFVCDTSTMYGTELFIFKLPVYPVTAIAKDHNDVSLVFLEFNYSQSSIRVRQFWGR